MKKAFVIIILLINNLLVMGQATPDTAAKGKLINSFYTADVLTDKQRIYTELVSKFPEAVDNQGANYDDLKRILAINYLMKDDISHYQTYISSIQNKVMLADFLYNVASHANYNNEATLRKVAMASALTVKLNNQFNKNPVQYKPANYSLVDWKSQVKKQKVNYVYTYAYILYKQKNYKQALEYIQPIYEHLKEPNDNIAELYSLCLGSTGNSQKAIKVIEDAINTGYQSETLMAELKKDYLIIHGNEADYDNYLSSLQSTIKAKKLARITKTIINKPAPAFSLKDLDGNTVSLKDLKGKIVIVDFWATWCAPCKASFPGMQLAVDKFKNNDQVKFLFIDTWESTKDLVPEIKSFINQSKYDFHVLLDETGSGGKQDKVSNEFKVDGIPTKFIIDKKGNIRFKSVGYIGNTNEIVETISTMIDLSLSQ